MKEIFPLLEQPRQVVITTHQKPDPDAMGSSLALAHFLRSLGHRVTVVSPTNWAAFLNWMPGCNEVIDFELKRSEAEAVLKKAEWLFCLDFNTLPRTKQMAPMLQKMQCVKVLIDHHQQPEVAAFNYGISDIAKSSTSEMIYDLIAESGHLDKITIPIAECLYAGIIGDTGSFRYPSASSHVHNIVAHLKQTGMNHTKVHENIYDNYLENRLRFIGMVLMHRMEIMYEYNTALISIAKNDLLRFDIKTGDTEGLVNFPLSIQGIKMAAIVIDRDEERKWSFRSKGHFDTNTFSRKYFDGGGHYNASGGRSSESLEKTVALFRQAVKENASLLQ
ncbi:MAG TPA: bifunctional oligoribonuclease/PAP phosphatase NrnA [Chitinophagaceae bacterium]